MNADEVRAWLAARYDDDERAAKAAADQGADDMPGNNWTYDSAVAQIIDERGRIVLASGGAGGTWLGRERGTHIARFDPARVLRDVAAKRRRLERHRPVEVRAGHDHLPPGHPGARQLLWVNCAHCIEDSGDSGAYDCQHANLRWPCPDVIDDAQAYADRSDFPAELRLP